MNKNVEIAKEAILNLFKTYSLEKEIIFGEILNLSEIQDKQLYDFTGLIGVSGNFEGGMYITCKTEFLDQMYQVLVHQDPERPFKKIFSDLVGELTNTLAGYFQKEYGERFLISVPYLIVGRAELDINFNFYLVPFFWKNIESNFVFSITDSKKIKQSFTYP